MSELQGLANSDLISIGFNESDHFTVGNSLKISLGRNRYLSAMCVGQGNEAVFICEKSKVGDHYTDLVCVHNRDYDGFITLEKLKAFIEWFGGEQKTQDEANPEPKWTTAYEILDELRGERESFTETRQKVEAQIENGARLAKHQIDL